MEENDEEHQLEHKRAHGLRNLKAILENFKCLQMNLDRSKRID